MTTGIDIGLPSVVLAQVDSVPAIIDPGSGGGGGATYEYVMGWNDPDCGSPTLRSWIATFEDTTGTQYSGPKCGATPITNAFVMNIIPG